LLSGEKKCIFKEIQTFSSLRLATVGKNVCLQERKNVFLKKEQTFSSAEAACF
jgi:hypothetical protein